MNSELTTILAAQHTRELAAQASARRTPIPQPRRRSRRRLPVPYRVSWTRVSLALTEGGRPRTSWAIVISASRAR